jgi:hypothetical protein
MTPRRTFAVDDELLTFFTADVKIVFPAIPPAHVINMLGTLSAFAVSGDYKSVQIGGVQLPLGWRVLVMRCRALMSIGRVIFIALARAARSKASLPLA